MTEMRKDKFRIWFMAASAAVVAFATLGTTRAVGILFVEVIRTYDLSREKAAWPFALQGCSLAFSGILPGLLEPFVSSRNQLYLGTTLVILGIGLCYFASTFAWFVFSYGVIFGVGYSILLPSTVVILNRDQKAHRATANGIMWTGDSLALFLMPPFYDFLIWHYGLRGSLLIVAGIFLNLFFFAYYLTRSTQKQGRSRIQTACEPSKNVKAESIGFTCGQYNVQGVMAANAEHLKRRASDEEVPQLVSISMRSFDSSPPTKETTFDTELQCKADGFGTGKSDSTEHKKANGTSVKKSKSRLLFVLHRAWKILIHPLFLLVTTIHMFYSFGIMLYCMVIFDHALNIGASWSSAVFVVTVFAAVELVGKVSGGFVTDRGYLSRRTLVQICEIGASLLLLIHAFFPLVGLLFAITAVLGLFNGICLTMSNVMYVELLGFENLALCVGIKNSIVGALSFLRPKIIGFSRDTFGSYFPLMLFLSVLSMLFGLSWFLHPMVKKPVPGLQLQQQQVKELESAK